MAAFQLVAASAGSGKTQELSETIASRVADGLDPSLILATTFTRKAAAELKSRAHGALLRIKTLTPSVRREKAERLEMAVIGTVHSVAHQLIRRYAIFLGLSPNLSVLETEGSERCLKDLLARMPVEPWNELVEVARKFAITDVQNIALKMLDAKRSNSISDGDFTQQMLSNANRLCGLLHPNGPTNTAVDWESLYSLAEKALSDIETKVDATKTTEDAKTELRRLIHGQRNTWDEYVKAAKLSAGKKSGADQCLSNLRAAAATVRRQPGLHDDVRELLARLADRVKVLESDYRAYKTERGLVDFTDLEVLFLQLLEDEQLTESLRADFSLVVVDEFQDTNPLQLAIFCRLRAIAQESRWVGDPKQAIYGFRGTDPDLVRAVWDNIPASQRRELKDNFRCQKGIVQLLGKLFEPIYGETVLQNPKIEALPNGIERWLFQGSNKDQDVVALACGVAQLKNEGVRYRDIAILARTNKEIENIGAALSGLGIPSLVELPGLFCTREGALTLAGLRLVADRFDSLAAATVLHILGDPKADTPEWLAKRLAVLKDAENPESETDHQPWHNDERLFRLEKIDSRSLPPSVVVQLVVQSLDLPATIGRWGDAARRLSHLDSILHLADRYENECWEFGTAATVTGLITYLEQLIADNSDIRRPPIGLDAVSVLSYHGSKGLEWPVVVLTSLDFGRGPSLWEPEVSGGQISSENPLHGRSIRYWPWPFGTNPYSGRELQGTNLEIDALSTPEGVAAARRNEQEAIRLLYVGFTRARNKLILAHRDGKCDWLGKLPALDSVLGSTAPAGQRSLNGIDTSFVIRHLDDGLATGLGQPVAPVQRWLTGTRKSTESTLHQRFFNPSAEILAEGSVHCAAEFLPGNSVFPSELNDENSNLLGNAVHAYFSGYASTSGQSIDLKKKVALRCLMGFGVEGIVSADELVSAGERFRAWLEAKYPSAGIHTEVPVLAPRTAGGFWAGVIDLVIVLPTGDVVVVDHKSAPLRRDQCESKATSFGGQLRAYKEALGNQKLNVRETWIHFPLASAVVLVE